MPMTCRTRIWVVPLLIFGGAASGRDAGRDPAKREALVELYTS